MEWVGNGETEFPGTPWWWWEPRTWSNVLRDMQKALSPPQGASS